MRDYNLDIVEKYYKNLDNEQFVKLLKTDSKGIRKEVIPILEKEIEKRNLSKTLLQHLEFNNKEFNAAELLEISNTLRAFPCPNCKTEDSPLNAAKIYSCYGVIFTSFTEESIFVACKSCLRKKNQNTIFHNILFGWWHPISFVSTPFYLYRNIKMQEQIAKDVPNETFIEFIKENAAYIERNKGDKAKLWKLICSLNSENA